MDQGWGAADAMDRTAGKPRSCSAVSRRVLWLGSVAALAAISGTLFAQESLLPPGFDNPPAPSRPAPQRSASPARPVNAPVRPVASAPAAASPSTAVPSTSTPVVQPIPTSSRAAVSPGSGASDQALLNSIDPALLEKLIQSAKPKFDLYGSAGIDCRARKFLGQQDVDLAGGATPQCAVKLGHARRTFV